MIYLIVKHFYNGKIELVKAYKNEEDARFNATRLISINNYLIGIYSVILED